MFFRSIAALALFAAVTSAQQATGPSAAPAAAPGSADAAAAPARPEPLPKEHPLQRALVTITTDDLREDENYLADDARNGRCAGEPSCDEAAEWIADRFDEDGLEKCGDDGGWFQAFEFPVRGGKKQATTRNVVAILRGRDPVLKDEYVVLGGHYDHVGTAKSADAGRIGGPVGDDSIWNGADDNASGTSSVLEVAQALAHGDIATKRSILFIAFSAEEQGLLGSLHYCQNPIVPLEKTVAMVNLDMVGRATKTGIELGALGSLQGGLWNRLCDAAWRAAPELDLVSHRLAYSEPGSDHHTFIQHSVPALYVFTGYHDDYHRVSDSIDKLDFEQMAKICRFVTALTVELADCTEPMKFEQPRFEARPRKTLGIGVDGALDTAKSKALGLPDDQGGYAVTSVAAGSVAEKAGLAVGDVIVSVHGKPISSDDPLKSLQRLVGGAPSNKDVEIGVLRAGKPVTLTARWE
jgi:hypothetical protein